MNKLLLSVFLMSVVPLVAMEDSKKERPKTVKREEKQQSPESKKWNPINKVACERRTEILRILDKIR